jgi:surface antigen
VAEAPGTKTNPGANFWNQEENMAFPKNGSVLIMFFICALLLASCQSGAAPGTAGGGVSTKGIIGGLGGATAGGLLAAGLGASPLGIAGSVIAGGLVGGYVGTKLDQADHREAEKVAVRALEASPSGNATNWSNPDSGNYGTFTPTRTYQTANGQYCREFKQTIYIDGEAHETQGTACRRPDGTWEIVNN